MAIELRFNGRRVPHGQLGKVVTDAIRKEVDESLRRRITAIRCPRHGRTGRLIKASPLDRYTVEACCEEFQAQLKNMLEG